MRKARVIQQGARYHVVARSNDRKFLLKKQEVKKLLKSVVSRAIDKFQFSLDSVRVVGNHVHFIIKPGEKESLSKIMQWILSVFAINYNRMARSTGHVWHDRFKSILIEE